MKSLTLTLPEIHDLPIVVVKNQNSVLINFKKIFIFFYSKHHCSSIARKDFPS